MGNFAGRLKLGDVPLPHLALGMVAALVLSAGLLFQVATPAHANNATLKIVKYTNGVNTSDPSNPKFGPAPTIPCKGKVTWTYDVSIVEAGDVLPITMDKVFNASGTGSGVVDDGGPGADIFPTYDPVNSIENSDPRLEIGEHWIFEASGTAIVGPYTNTVVATGFQALLSEPVSATDVSNYTGVPCDSSGPVLGRMTGGGSVFTVDNVRVTRGFEIHCDLRAPNNIEVNWPGGNNFHMNVLTSAVCTDAPGYEEAPPEAGFDTFDGVGTGKLNNVPGASIKFHFEDHGEPGNTDIATIRVFDQNNVQVLLVSGPLKFGNIQAHKDNP